VKKIKEIINLQNSKKKICFCFKIIVQFFKANRNKLVKDIGRTIFSIELIEN